MNQTIADQTIADQTIADQAFSEETSSIEHVEVVHQILEVVCRTTGLGFAAVGHMTESHWVACAVRDEVQFGVQAGDSLPVEATLCDEIRRGSRYVVIDNLSEDPDFSDHPTARLYGFQSYISVPIHLPGGRLFGTLCAVDRRPALLSTPGTIGMFQLFADLIGRHLDARERVVATEAALLSERETAKLREQFIAVLGHDLRNPLAAIDAGIQVLRALPGGEDSAPVLDLLQRSTARMSGLINDVLDFARGRLGGGLPLQRVPEASLESILGQVVAELQAASPERTIHREFSIPHPVLCDSARLSQMLSNLLANALAHGRPGTPVWVSAHSCEAGFELSVTNLGDGIEPHIMENLFEPFARGRARPGEEGLGLGLYIASEIARAHGGSLQAESAGGKVRFTFQMPSQMPSQNAV